MKLRSMSGAVLLLALLCGCAGEQPVRVSAYRESAFSTDGAARTYALQMQAGADSNAARLLDDAMTAQGLRPASTDNADYLIELGYATRPQRVRVQAACLSAASESACGDTEAPPRFFGRKRYVHALTVQFVERASGVTVYRVSVTHADRDPDPDAALPALMKCAFAGFPLQNAERRELARCD
ncbi:DUF4136 domain-containing protein [Caballeronia sp. DA-9]|uniref:DUF4136 domain-containing protein n=1 Tax=Caballeronia sp. DA-9 TaxID=3436237 RepID=UPI003F666C06